MEMLATVYGDGDSVGYDFDAYVKWDMKAIEVGSITSLSNLAITYRAVGDMQKARKVFS